MYLNRGYTVWFHLIAVGCLATRSDFLRRFLILQGASISLGWYSALFNDWYCHSRFFHILYMNMPTAIKALLTCPITGEIVYTSESRGAMVLSIVLDALAHPGLAYFFWRQHVRERRRRSAAAGGDLRSVLAWPVLLSHFAVSRVWSLVHTYHNFGALGLYYFGYDVYHLNDLDCWIPAYTAEGLLHLGIVLWKVGFFKKSVIRNWGNSK